MPIYLPAGVAMPTPSREIGEAVRDILAAEEFAKMHEAPDHGVEALGEILSTAWTAVRLYIGLFNEEYPALFVVVLVATLAGLAVAVWYGAKGIARRGGIDGGARAPIPEQLRGDPESLWRQARVLQREGRYLEAVRLAFRATIIAQAVKEGTLDNLREAPNFRRARTYRELVDEFARGSVSLEKMHHMADRLEHGLYRGAELTSQDWEDVCSLSR